MAVGSATANGSMTVHMNTYPVVLSSHDIVSGPFEDLMSDLSRESTIWPRFRSCQSLV